MTSISTKKEQTNERGGKSCWAGRKVGNTNSERTSQLTHNRPPTNNTCSILSIQPVHVQGAALGESNQQQYKSNWAGLQRWPHQSHWHCRQSSQLIIGEAERPNLTWLHADHSHHLEKQVEMIYLSLVVNLFERGGVKGLDKGAVQFRWLTSDWIYLYLWCAAPCQPLFQK